MEHYYEVSEFIFNDETKKNLIEDDKSLDNTLFNEADSSDRHHFRMWKHMLIEGILFENNWENLSDKDVQKWAIVYGCFKKDRKEQIKYILKEQNKMLDEIEEKENVIFNDLKLEKLYVQTIK